MARARDRSPTASVEEALRRSARHTRNAIAEASLATIALLDAISIPLTGRHAAEADSSDGLAGRGLSMLSRRLDELARMVRSADTRLPDELLTAILDALGAEIARWEERSKEDPDARAVLRAFLGLREILWEFGVRGRSAGSTPPGSGGGPHDPSESSAKVAEDPDGRSDDTEIYRTRRRETDEHARRPRVQRIRIDD